MISRLSGPDAGPLSKDSTSNWEKKVISSSSNKMFVEFKSDDDTREYRGFSTSIQFIQSQSQECKSLLNMRSRLGHKEHCEIYKSFIK